jgi:hypothetical protein
MRVTWLRKLLHSDPETPADRCREEMSAFLARLSCDVAAGKVDAFAIDWRDGEVVDDHVEYCKSESPSRTTVRSA